MFGARLKELREKRNLSQRQLARILKTSPSSVAMYELDQRSPDKEMISLISTFFQVPTDYLLGLTNNPTPYFNAVPDGTEQGDAVFPIGSQREINIYNLIPKNGDEIFAKGNVIGCLSVPADDMTSFIIQAIDDSMSKGRINEGDLVHVKEQNSFENNQAVFVRLQDNSHVIRKAMQTNDGVILYPESYNPVYSPIVCSNNDITILGIVIKVTFDYI